MITRRGVLKATAGVSAAAAGLAGYGIGIEPLGTPRVVAYRSRPPGWPRGLNLRIAVLADIHCCEPWMTVERVAGIVETTNRLAADIVVLLGDYTTAHRFVRTVVPERAWADALGGLKAPLGVHAVLGNHDWWSDLEAQWRGAGPTRSHVALAAAGIKVYDNDAVRLAKGRQAFWLAGLADQIALIPSRMAATVRAEHQARHRARPDFALRRQRIFGLDDVSATLAKVTDTAPVIMLAHEPDIFPVLPSRVSLTLSGHTHGGQVRILGWAPVVPSRYKGRFDYGHIVEQNRHLIVSGGLGCSMVPVRIGMPPEIVVVEVGA